MPELQRVADGPQGARGRARCHYCNYSLRAAEDVRASAPGRISSSSGSGPSGSKPSSARCFPAARVARVDRDTVRRRGAIARVLARFAAGELDVLVGTQMIAKGHDFPRVTLVGVVSADVGLGLADFRAGERTFQLLTQVAGRAGRGEQPGEAIVQTLLSDTTASGTRALRTTRLFRPGAGLSRARCAIRRPLR